jgi:hypothetical protein
VDGDGDKIERTGAVSEQGSAVDKRWQDKDRDEGKDKDKDTVTA